MTQQFFPGAPSGEPLDAQPPQSPTPSAPPLGVPASAATGAPTSMMAGAQAPRPIQPPQEPPTLFNGATVHGWFGIRALRHPKELPLMAVCGLLTLGAYASWIGLVAWLIAVPEPTGAGATARSLIMTTAGQYLLLVPLIPIILWVARAVMYAQLRAQGVQMSFTQFPEGYRMVVEAAHNFGMRRVPDAYVMLGNGKINAFAAGHGFRRYVVVYSDLFEAGGSARDPEALRFVINHEVGHLAAGHVSFLRLAITTLGMQIPLIGPALSRAQEYTADNHGYANAPQGAPGTMGILAAGKYLGAQVNFHALADRAVTERGFWLHIASWRTSHPVLTWRAHALRDRSRPGRLMIRPKQGALAGPISPVGRENSKSWPTPGQVLAFMDATRPRVAEEQFGRYPGVEYEVPRDAVRLADPRPVGR
ncbi:Zn-dependent protease with chaperone function [Actinomyces denticolens]|uniref:Zn-dependent protease with chaperone function n=1 Tax=Actinomyces denticolens TaxID=52767 RepID=A0ABY1IFP8_9ACTO|nr:Zn-dependent protease with chaperone function [Actinomyces denticolens]